jgi:hypothetical protein
MPCRHMNEQPDRFSDQTLRTVRVGLEGAPDLEAAQRVPAMIRTIRPSFACTRITLRSLAHKNSAVQAHE